MSIYTTQYFIDRVKIIHYDFYCYDETIYSTNSTKVIIICPLHGEFNQRPDKHLAGMGCPSCGYERARISRLKSSDAFVIQASDIHQNKWSYERTIYVNSKRKVIITCSLHGGFQTNSIGSSQRPRLPKMWSRISRKIKF